ncbi:fruit protein pKIWI501 isoform X2 [Drosophila busckii]|nr:fruit protein pKIWI501 isoform X2 [Drosophila busckii]
MFNNQATQHKQSQLLNPFSHDGRATSPKPTFSKDQYGKPLAGSLTEMRGQKANMHVMKEMLELCQIIDSEGYQVKDEPTMRVIPFGELFNIYNYISDKVVGILLRARKHKLLEFEGEMLYQRRDDNVPIFLLRPIADIRHEINAKVEEIKRGTSPAPQSTSVLLDKSAHEKKLKSRTPSPAVPIKAKSKSPVPKAEEPVAVSEAPVAAPAVVIEQTAEPEHESAVVDKPETATATATEAPAAASTVAVEEKAEPTNETQPEEVPAVVVDTVEASPASTASDELPTIVIEASATFVRTVSVEKPDEKQVEGEAAAAESA